jgi:hypothetical protein
MTGSARGWSASFFVTCAVPARGVFLLLDLCGNLLFEAKNMRYRRKLSEAWDALWDTLVDPSEAYGPDEESAWIPLGGETSDTSSALVTAAQLREIRNQCRLLAMSNEFAINGHENRISYIVGPGHVYRVAAKRGLRPPRELLSAAQSEVDRFLAENRWQQRQQEIVRRRDRDGEVFLRFHVSPLGSLQVRFIEPGAVFTPPQHAEQPGARLGIVTQRDDVEDVQGYYVEGHWIAASEIQHRKAHVDANVLRGMPLFYPVRKNLRRAEKLLRNMSAVAEIQSAIALIRKHRQATRGGLESLVANTADYSTTAGSSTTGTRPAYVRRYAPGTILDAPGTVDYEFPAAQLNASAYVAILQAELRAIASRLVMPEFMLTSDASNANYSSTLVAEGPAMRMFARLQAEQVAADQEVLTRALQTAIAAGRLPHDLLAWCDVQAAPPSLIMRDQLHEARRRSIEHRSGILSPQTWSQQLGLDYEQEQANFAEHRHGPE